MGKNCALCRRIMQPAKGAKGVKHLRKGANPGMMMVLVSGQHEVSGTEEDPAGGGNCGGKCGVVIVMEMAKVPGEGKHASATPGAVMQDPGGVDKQAMVRVKTSCQIPSLHELREPPGCRSPVVYTLLAPRISIDPLRTQAEIPCGDGQSLKLESEFFNSLEQYKWNLLIGTRGINPPVASDGPFSQPLSNYMRLVRESTPRAFSQPSISLA
ncbi:uncharacterized protein CANTADRAFT_23100 [Suhomyces tanzawaensis NRRL Y-17324]|uniref:Uncharacterized protein n=1 Tax=Suhomyces tanzawaensis NRRL Y-17324 TaxID=984487 RepID=A0A1E4SEN2_9ASCO|nr:uncharacterized protein CANTADRAFT_23100 [Suhomyces tanzawaensis NRRL Y-17324]ODV77989.1 hypothetical protein CANTADRAFT_23100 [Suhomyces tanzawaensis NRRL Y-17324]